jgi:2'-5' RNA ligase
MDAFNLRLFVAIELPAKVRETLAATIDVLRRLPDADALRWVRPEGIHVTLKFLGSVHEEDLPAINTNLTAALAGASTFDLTAVGLGSFGGPRRLRVVWAGVGGDVAALAALAERVEGACAPLGFKREQRPYSAHLTLARVRETTSREQRERLYKSLEEVSGPDSVTFRARHCALMQSTLTSGGAVYNALAAYPLAEVL